MQSNGHMKDAGCPDFALIELVSLGTGIQACSMAGKYTHSKYRHNTAEPQP